jgi:hypothetical protein
MQAQSLRSTLRGCVFVAMLVLGGCASMSEDECLTVDWRTIGFEDGAAGYTGDRIGQHRKACAKHGVTPDLTAYRSGRDEGLREYCHPNNGFRLGARGGSYNGLCPADLDGPFVTAYQSGRQLYELESRLNDATSELQSKRRALNNAEEDIVTKSALVISKEATGEQRAQAIVDVKQLAERAGRLKAEIRQLEEERVHRERDLEDYRAQVQYIR